MPSPVRALLVIFAILAVGMPGAVANAHPQVKTDPAEEWLQSRFDIRRMRLTHGSGRINAVVKTEDRWRGRHLRCDNCYIAVWLDPQGESQWNEGYRVHVVYRKRALRAVVLRVDSDGWTKVGRADLSRPNRKSVRISVRRGLIGATDADWVKWQVLASGDGGQAAWDTAPNGMGWYRHPL